MPRPYLASVPRPSQLPLHIFAANMSSDVATVLESWWLMPPLPSAANVSEGSEGDRASHELDEEHDEERDDDDSFNQGFAAKAVELNGSPAGPVARGKRAPKTD